MAVFFRYVVFIPTCSQMEIHSNAIYLKTEMWLLMGRTQAQSNNLGKSLDLSFTKSVMMLPNQTKLNGANANVVARICKSCFMYLSC